MGFKKGDRVKFKNTNGINEIGNIETVTREGVYKIVVNFDVGTRRTFTIDGRHNEYQKIRLFKVEEELPVGDIRDDREVGIMELLEIDESLKTSRDRNFDDLALQLSSLNTMSLNQLIIACKHAIIMKDGGKR